jgi:hypothetical protein
MATEEPQAMFGLPGCESRSALEEELVEQCTNS